MLGTRPLSIPVILGTPRRGRWSEHVARLLVQEIGKRQDVETGLVDVCDLPVPSNDAGEAVKDARFSETVMRADGLVIVAPEYNHGYPGILKHTLDTNLKEYVHKPVGLCGVSAGGFGGTRVIENLLPVMRELGLVTIFWDVNVSGVQKPSAPRGSFSTPPCSGAWTSSWASWSGWRAFCATGARRSHSGRPGRRGG